MTLTSAPAEPVVTLADAKAHLRVRTMDDDALIQTLVDAATAHLDGAAGILGMAMVTQTWRQDDSAWPADGILSIRLRPVQSVSGITYLDTAGDEQTLATDQYIVSAYGQGTAIVRPSGVTWPGLLSTSPASTSVTFIVGFGAAAAVPAPLKLAIKELVGHWYENREAAVIGSSVAVLPFGFEAMVSPYRAMWC
jgi:uncharacterized phiE125 gp8 family phage protein